MDNSLGEVRATDPLQTGTFQTSYEILATCAKELIETDSWRFGQPVVQSMRERDRPLIRVYAIYSRSTLFEVTFQPALSGLTTVVEYREGMTVTSPRLKPGASLSPAPNKALHQSLNLLERLGGIIEMGQRVAQRISH